MVNVVVAKPDENVALTRWSDLFNLASAVVNPLAPGALELEKIGNRYIRNHFLPGTDYPVPVSYHLKEPFAINADGVLTIPLFTAMHMTADLHSCTGPGGPWTGTITFSEVAGGSVKAMEKLFGTHGTDSGQFTEPITFSLNLHSGARQMIHIPTASGDMGIWLQLDQQAVDTVTHAAHLSPIAFPVVGNGSWTFGGEDVTVVSDMLGPAYPNGLSLPIVATPLDPRCTTGSLQDDTFDQE